MRNALRVICRVFLFPVLCLMILMLAVSDHPLAMVPSAPTIQVSVVSDFVYSDSITFDVKINRNGKTIEDWALKYSLDGQATWQTKKGLTVTDINGVVTYRVVVSNLPPEQTIHYRAYLVYNSGATTITTDIAVTQTKALPEINITISQVDTESITFSIVFIANGNKLEMKTFESQLPGGEWIPHTTDTDNMMVGHMGLQPGTTIHYRGSVTYIAGGGATKELRTPEMSASTNLLPVITVSVTALDYESMTVQADIDTNGNTITNSGLVYKFNDTPYTIAFDDTHRVSPNRYSVVIPDLPAEDLIQIRGTLTYLAYSFQSGDVPRDIQGDVQSVWTKKPPEYRIVVSNVDFNHVAFTMDVAANGNPIEKTVFEHRFYTNETWIPETQTGGSSWGLSFSALPGITTVFYRGYLICQTGLAKREFRVDEQFINIYTIHTRASWYQWHFNNAEKKGDLEVFGSIRAYKLSPDDISYLDKGFVWAEHANSVIKGDHVISLGAEDLPDELVVLSAKIRDVPVGRTVYYRAYAVSENSTVYYGHLERFVSFAVDVPVYTPTPTPYAGQVTSKPTTTGSTTQQSEPSAQETTESTSASQEATPTPDPISPKPEPTPATTEPQGSGTAALSPTPLTTKSQQNSESSGNQQVTTASLDFNRQTGPALSQNQLWIWLMIVIILGAAGGLSYFIWRKRYKKG